MLELTALKSLQNTTFGMNLKTYFIAILLAVVATPSFGQSIWTNPITGTNPGLTSPYTTGDIRDANITVSGITRGPGVTGNVANNRYNANGWSTGAISNDYFEFTLTPNAGYRIDFASFVYTGQSSGTGPTSFGLFASTNGYATAIGTATAGGTTISLSAGVFQNRTVATTFRLYAWNASGAAGTYSINDFTFNGSVNSTCASVTLTSVLPTNGPVGTEVTIQAAGGLTGATATFSGIAAPIVSSTATQLVVTVPAGATTGNLVVKDATLCASTPIAFTVINQDNTSCEGNSSFTDVIISEIFDDTAGSGGAIELFNPTSAAINLGTGNYRIRRFVDNGPTFSPDLVFGSVTIPSGGTILVTAVASPLPSCTGFTYSATLGTGFNENDRFELRKNTTTVIDVAYGATVAGYSVLRNTNAVGPTATYNAADWSISTTPDCSDLGYFPPITKVPPTLTVSPTVTLTCTSTSVTLTANGTEGHTGGNPIAFQWFYLAPATNTWIAVTNNANYSGALTGSLTITPVSSFNNYQYYCQIRENTATCYKASNATIIKDTYFTTWTTAWSNGTPSLTKRAIIDGNYNTTTNGSFEACSVVVNAARTLTITPSEYVAIQNDLTVNGTLNIQDDGSLVQISDTGVNTGNIGASRNVMMGKYDYVYWSSPVANFPVTSVSSGTATNYIFKWNPTQAGNYGIWVSANENMVNGKGYILRGPSAFPTTPSLFSTTFTGVPNNGVITASIQRGSYTGSGYNGPNGWVTNKDDNWNLVGNPYPSSIRVMAFLTANSNIEGAVRLWTHGSQPSSAVSDPFYGNYMYNYNSNDYIVHNGTGTVSGPGTFSGYIASGQGFFIQMNDGATATQTVTFNNAMRDKSYTNSDFFRGVANSNDSVRTDDNAGEDASGRIWIDLVSADAVVTRTLVGYVDGATLDKDRLYDAYGKLDNNQNFYSLIAGEAMTIQGRPLPFDNSDMVPLGMHLAAAGTYKIAISAVNGIFEDVAASIYLEDKLLGIIHDLRQSPYEFSAQTGMTDTRFVLRYTNHTLGNQDFDVTDNGLVVATPSQQIAIKSSVEPIQKVEIYDLLGRNIYTNDAVNSTELVVKTIAARHQPLVVKATLKNGQVATRKIVF